MSNTATTIQEDPTMTTRTVQITAVKKRTGERIEGTFRYDGLASLWAVDTADGVKYVSVLDTIIEWVES